MSGGREAANRVTSTCWYQRRRGAFGVDSSTRGRVAERDLNQAYPLGVALGINFSFLLSLCVWACQRRADALLSVGDYSAALKDLEALQCMGCTDTASRLADCRHRVKRGGPAPQPDHYAVMGVASTASASDIKQAYRSVRTASQGEGDTVGETDHYAVMGVASTASASDVKQAYRSVRTASQGEGDTVGETDHYAVMGVASSASASDVKQAYRSVRTASQGEGDTVGERHGGRDGPLRGDGRGQHRLGVGRQAGVPLGAYRVPGGGRHGGRETRWERRTTTR
jgi:DnaJ-domain-containing protein 1